MKVAILAGGLGTRLAEETSARPKPMVEIGEHPILWHIMQIYATFGFKEFVIALGYKGDVIKEHFINYRRRSRSCTVSLATGEVTYHDGDSLNWTVHLLETGLHTQTGGRIKRIAEYLDNEPFLLTYGDGVCNIDIRRLVEFHQRQGKLATVTVVRPPARFGSVVFDGELMVGFEEKPQLSEGWINGGFFVLRPEVTRYIAGDESIWEREPMERLAADGQLAAYKHEGFWQCMDTLRDVRLLNSLWESGNPPWKVWSP
jgi:glucose-1-phosphate cytidylyltransferase